MPRIIRILAGVSCFLATANAPPTSPEPPAAVPATPPVARPSSAAAPTNPPAIPPALVQARIEAARKLYQLNANDYRLGWLPWSEPVYRWSRRLLESELDRSARKADQLVAYKGHLQRMRDLERIAKDRFRRQDTTVDESLSTDYYLLEAQAWVDQANQR